MQTRYISYSTANPPSLLRKVAVAIVALAVAGVALMFSAVLLGVLLIAGALAWVYVWWQTRTLRKQLRQMQNFPPQSAPGERDAFDAGAFSGTVIEGEAVRVDEPADRAGNRPGR